MSCELRVASEIVNFFTRNSRLKTLSVLPTAEHIEHDVEKQAAATDEHGWGKHKKSPFPWDVPLFWGRSTNPCGRRP